MSYSIDFDNLWLCRPNCPQCLRTNTSLQQSPHLQVKYIET